VKKVIIAGASGLIGSHLIRLLSQTYEVHALSRTQTISESFNVVWHHVDLNKVVDYSKLPQDTCAFIYLAQSEYFRDFPEKALDIFQLNTTQVLSALDFSRSAGIENFIYASSGGVYGFPEKIVSEQVTIPASGNLGFYLSTKLCAEILVENYSKFMNVAMLRFFFVYGSGQKRSMLLPRMADNIRRGSPILLQGRDGIKINPIHVSDAVRAIEASLVLKGCHRINIAGQEILSLRDISNIIGKTLNLNPNFEVDLLTTPGNLIAEIENMRRILVTPAICFNEGVFDVL